MSALLLLAFALTSCGNHESITMHFASFNTADPVEQRVYYTDEYFLKPASEYNPQLATASAYFALAGFAAVKGAKYEHSADHASEYLANAGFSHFYANADGLARPTAHSYGVYMASKDLGEYTLLAVTTRGAFYDSEWSSNFRFGEEGDFAVGFLEASDIYLNAIRDYINARNITGKIKIWTAGYSRGGAGVNLSIGRLDDALKENNSLLGDHVSYTKEDLYAYCFETPAGRIGTVQNGAYVEKGSDYNNIHCIMDFNDPIPLFGPEEFGFIRYGIDYYLPDVVTDLNYESHINQVKNQMSDLPNSDVVGEYKIEQFQYATSFFNLTKKLNWGQGSYLRELIALLSVGIGSREEYATGLEAQITGLLELFYKNDTPKDSLIDLAINIGKNIILLDTNEIVMHDLQHNIKRVWQDLRPLLQAALKKITIEGISPDELLEFLKSVATILTAIALSGQYAIFPTLFHFDNIKGFGAAHIPEMILCHMKALDRDYTRRVTGSLSTSYYRLDIHSEADYAIRHGNKTIAEKEDGEIKTSLTAEISYVDSYYLPANQIYQIEAPEKVSATLYQISGFTEEPIEISNIASVIEGDVL